MQAGTTTSTALASGHHVSRFGARGPGRYAVTARAGSLLAETGSSPGVCAGALARVASARRAASGAESPRSPGPLTR